MRNLNAVIEPSEIEAKLKQAFPDAELEIEDLTGTRDHYQARVVTVAFEGKSMIQQHQLVYGALKEEMKGPIHALALKTFTPDAWKAKQG